MTHPMQTHVNDMQKMILEDLNNGQEKIFKALVMELQVNKLPERIFREYFLQGFIGKHPNNRWVAEWIGVAGTPSAEVSIIDEVGNELFLVPPLIASTSMLITRHNSGVIRINDIVTHTGNIANNSPAQAMAFMTSALGQKSQELAAPTSMQSIAVRWARIFERYGIVFETAQNSESVQPAAGEDPLFDFG